MTIGECIKKNRKLAGLTQKELALKCEFATGTIQQYELGKRQPRIEQLEIIADALEISLGELIGSNDRKDIPSDFGAAWNRKEKRRLQYLQSLGYKIELHPDDSFEIYCDGYQYSIPHLDPQEYYDMICEVVDSTASNIIEQIIEEFKFTEKEI